MKTKHIVHISLGTNVGGMEKLLVEFARFADRSKFDLTFISLQEPGQVAAEIESLHWPVISLSKTPGLKLSVIAKLAKLLRTRKPTVVHTHNAAGQAYGVTAAKFARVPRVIHTRHGQCSTSTARQKMMYRSLSHWIERIVSVSNDGQQLTIRDGIAPEKAVTIHNGVDLRRFPQVRNRPIGRAIVVARLSPEKDIASLIQAMKIATEQTKPNEIPFTLDIVGDGQQRQSLEALTRSLMLQDAIRFCGESDRVSDQLASASMSVLPSLTEGISLTLLEAMATGLPVVACSVGGNPEVVSDQETGILVPPGDPQALAEAMLRLHRDPALAERYGDAGRLRAEKMFCVRKMVRAYESLYSGKEAA
ncbi:Glycogen synthase [Planctomycetes bacterium CA13]|uniref:Glycogen synthase n=1 Tax=Novipirellula herctigrandis TaxID=2527986 RepID=A0A5C5Z5T2_9BACT|nr:Glycogen synthase [Planctomycetes bacterium CA13]